MDEKVSKKYVEDEVAIVSTGSTQESRHRLAPLPISTLVTKEVADLRTPTTAWITTSLVMQRGTLISQ